MYTGQAPRLITAASDRVSVVHLPPPQQAEICSTDIQAVSHGRLIEYYLLCDSDDLDALKLAHSTHEQVALFQIRTATTLSNSSI